MLRGTGWPRGEVGAPGHFSIDFVRAKNTHCSPEERLPNLEANSNIAQLSTFQPPRYCWGYATGVVPDCFAARNSGVHAR